MKKIKKLKRFEKFLQQNKSRILLLIDGYDEIQYLLGTDSNKNKIAKSIIKELKTYPNFIMTSRPNAVPENFFEKDQGNFDSQIENIGLDDQGIKQYVRNFLQNEQNKNFEISLIQFLDENRNIKNIVSVPINIIMICLAWKDKSKYFEKGLTITKLYEEMVIFLGKRYLKKWEDKSENDIKNLLLDDLFKIPVARSIKRIAFDGFQTKLLLINGSTIHQTLSKLKQNGETDITIDNVVNFGLTVVENKKDLNKQDAQSRNTELIRLNHQFIHKTFQEFLTAIYLKDQLLSDTEFTKAQYEIINGKDEQDYLMVLKFLAGLVSENDKGFERFWTAIQISKDDQIEIGGKKQIDLLFHLLSQSIYSEGKIYQKITQKIQEYVDAHVLNKIGAWQNMIKDTGYKPQNIAKLVKDKLNSRDINEVLEAISLLNLFGFKDENVILSLKNKIEEQIEKQIPSIYILTELINTIGKIGIGSTNSDEILIKLIDDYGDNEAILIASVFALTKSFNIENLDKVIQKFIDKLQKNNSFASQPLIDGLVQICTQQKKAEIIKCIKEHLDNSLLNGEIALYAVESLEMLGIPKKDIFDELINILKSGEISKQIYAAKALGNIGKGSEAATYALNDKLTQIKIKKNNEKLENIIRTSLEKIETTNNLKQFNFQQEKYIKHNVSWKDVKNWESQQQAEKVKSNPKLVEICQELVKKRFEDENSGVRETALQVLEEIVKSDPKQAEKGIKLFKNRIEDDSSFIRITALQALAKKQQSNPKLAEIELKLIQKRIEDGNSFIRVTAIQALAEIVKSNPKLSEKGLELIEIRLKNDNSDVIETALQALSDIVKSDHSQAEKSLELINDLIEDENSFIRETALQTLAQIVKSNPKLSEKGLELIEIRLKNDNSDVIETAILTLAEIVKSDPKLAEKGIKLIEIRIKNDNNDVIETALQALSDIAKSDPQFAVICLELIKNLIEDKNGYVKKLAQKAYISILRDFLGVFIQNKWIFTKLIDNLSVIKDQQHVQQIISFMAINFKELPKIILEKLIIILNDKYEKEAEFIIEKFKFLEDQKHNGNQDDFKKLIERFEKGEDVFSNLLQYIIDNGLKFEKNQDGNIIIKINDKEVARKDESYCYKLLSSLQEKSKELNKPLLMYFPFKENQVFSIVKSDKELEFDKYYVTILRHENQLINFIYTAIFETKNLFGQTIIFKITNASFKTYEKSIKEKSKKEIFEGSDKFYTQSFSLQGFQEIMNFIQESKKQGKSLKNLISFINSLDENINIDFSLRAFLKKSDTRSYESLVGCTQSQEELNKLKEFYDMLQKEFEEIKKELNQKREAWDDFTKKNNEKMFEQKELKQQLNSSYNISFFNCFVKTLNASWMAANLVSNTNIIKNSKKGKISDIIEYASFLTDHLPIIGSGLKLFGKLLKAVDDEKQSEMVGILDKFAEDHNKMDDFSRKLAIKLLQHGINKDRLSKPDDLGKRCSKWLKYAQQSLVHIFLQPPDDSFLGDNDENLGEKHAQRAANIVIGKIYEGELGKDRFGAIESFAIEEFCKSKNERVQDNGDSNLVKSGLQFYTEN